MKPKLAQLKQPTTPANVRAAVLKVLTENYPFFMIAKRPTGEWETSCHYRRRLVSDDEVIGVLHRAAHRIMAGDMGDEEDEGSVS